MSSSHSIAPFPRLHRKALFLRANAFSLVEVVLAIGVVAFAFVGLLALMPVGLTNFRKAMDTSISAQIVQQISAEIEQTDFDSLLGQCQPQLAAFNSAATAQSGILYWQNGNAKFRYFDDQGNEVTPANGGSLQGSEKQKVLYWVLTRIARSQLIPGSTTDTTGRANNQDLLQVTMQVLNNPANTTPVQVSDTSDPNYLLVDASKTPTPFATYVLYVSRNGYSNPSNSQ